MKRLAFPALGVLLALVASGFGCELIAVPDRSKIDAGGRGGTGGETTGGGGAGGTTTGGGGAGGTTTGGGGAGGTTMTGGGGTGGMPCRTVDDCPPASGDCVAATCEDGLCDEAPTPAGEPATTQQPGDCKVSQCDGAGTASDVNDDLDVPVDDNECTDDVCTDGVASNPFLAEGTTCATGGGSQCNGTGSCVECITAADCAGQDTECQTITCNAGVCGVANTTQGTVVASQIDGDCKVDQCDGLGGVESVPDDMDPEDDGNECTDNSCNAGMTVTSDAVVNTACGTGGALFCDGQGSCVGCTDAVQCGTPSNQCLVAVCGAGGVCGTADKPDNTACDDGNACSQTDTCQAGACTGADPVVCTALDQCHDVGVCDTGTGVCSDPAKADNTACNDGNACTQADTCQAGACTGANPVVCTALDQCHDVGVCDTGTGVCSNPNKADNTACIDGTACSQASVCQAGFCVGIDFVVCTVLDQCHDVGTCNSTTGVCSNPVKADNTACNDGNACTQADTCQAGSCTAGSPVVCTALDDCHDVGVCDTDTGVCSNPAKADNTACNDGNACTQADTCQAGSCTSGSPVVCTALDDCHDVGVCDTGTGVCSNPAKADNTACNDNDACTTTSSCQAGTCTGANPVVCTALDDCHVAGVCDTGTGVCSNPLAGDGTACTTGGDPGLCAAGVCIAATCNDNAKNGDETDVDCGGSCPTDCANGDDCVINGDCTSGICDIGDTNTCVQCLNAGQCPAGDECKTAVCNPDNTCGFTFTDAGTVVSSQIPGDCKRNECDGAGNAAPVAFDTDLPVDGNQCTDDVCTAGEASNPAKANNTACDDSNACTQADTCQAGVCTGANPVVCTALDDCHDVGTCDTGTGLCSNPAKADNTACDDSNACTATSSCQAGTCTGANPVVCTALDDCHDVGTCDTGTGVCSNPAKPDNTACNDNNACTAASSCQAGTCTGTNPVVCTALDECHDVGTCDTGTGLCSNPAKADNTACNDNDACTTADTCQAGTCTGASPVVCTALDDCHDVGTCDTGTGLCSNPAKADGATCTDGNACTTADTCQAGACTAGTPVVCTALDDCHDVGTCDTGTGVCSNPAKADNTACDDTNDCTGTDVCTAGACDGTILPAGTMCNQNGGTSCNAFGSCVVPPSVMTTVPAEAATAVVTPSLVSVTFTQAMTVASLTAQTTVGACTGSIQLSADDFASCLPFSAAAPAMSGSNTIATLTPATGFAVGRTHKLRVTTAATNASGAPLAATFTQATGFTTEVAPATCQAAGVVMSQVYGGGGAAAGLFKSDFVELYNAGAMPVDLSTWALHYAATTGTSWTRNILSGTIQPGRYFLVKLGGTNGILDLPPADHTTGTITANGTAGKIVLTNTTATVSGACPSGANVVDIVGYGAGTNCFEGTGPTENTSPATSAVRRAFGCTETNSNAADFAIGQANPRNSSFRRPANETGAANEADYCVLFSPETINVSVGMGSGTILGRIYEAGVTETALGSAQVTAEVGYGLAIANPEVSMGWIWTPAAFTQQTGPFGNDDEYGASFNAPPLVGVYNFAFRFSLDAGASWTYCDLDRSLSGGDAGAGSLSNLAFQPETMGVMTVTP